MEEQLCTSCQANTSVLTSSSNFKCPGCGDTIIARCGRCRRTVTAYLCSNCGFEGP
ncbi:MAG: RNA-binding protein [Candidatus Altiarchaeota archaeon]|nr:RNA-binding protein [Candidatus Altiarchaeota archaeon]